MRFAKFVFWIAGVWGLLVLTPLYFMFDLIGKNDPPLVHAPRILPWLRGLGSGAAGRVHLHCQGSSTSSAVDDSFHAGKTYLRHFIPL